MCGCVQSTLRISALEMGSYLLRAEPLVPGNSPGLEELLELGPYHASLERVPPFLPWLPFCHYWSLLPISQQPLALIRITDTSLSSMKSSDNASPSQCDIQTSGSCRLVSNLCRVQPCPPWLSLGAQCSQAPLFLGKW